VLCRTEVAFHTRLLFLACQIVPAATSTCPTSYGAPLRVKWQISVYFSIFIMTSPFPSLSIHTTPHHTRKWPTTREIPQSRAQTLDPYEVLHQARPLRHHTSPNPLPKSTRSFTQTRRLRRAQMPCQKEAVRTRPGVVGKCRV